MVVRTLVFLVAISAIDVAAAADIESRVEAVTVYPDGAIVTRVAQRISFGVSPFLSD